MRALAELSPVEDILLRDPARRPARRRRPVPDRRRPELPARAACAAQPQFGAWDADPRFTDSADVVVHTFAEDPDGDEDAAILAEAVRVVLRDAWLTHVVVPGRGHLTHVEMTSRAAPGHGLGDRHRPRAVRRPPDRGVALRDALTASTSASRAHPAASATLNRGGFAF